MTEMTIYGRGGQGGVTLAKLIATTYFLRGKYAQAFGLYAAERSGAPIQAFVRVDDRDIVNHNLIRHPDHVIVLDRTLIGPHVVQTMRESGWLILNSPDAPETFGDIFPGRHVATIDATRLALEFKLGTRTVPIVNTTMLGAIGCVFGVELHDIEAALRELGFGDNNLRAAARAYDDVRGVQLDGEVSVAESARGDAAICGLFDDEVGGAPQIQTGSWATRRPQRAQLLPPCNQGCPAGNDVRAFIAAVHEGDCDHALRILHDTSPFPGVCGRVCPAPCMEACNRANLDNPVNVRELERYAAKHGRPAEPVLPWRDEHIAIVGSGPAGLTAAYALARLGYHITLFENHHLLGGALRTGIPHYRLPPAVLDREIEHVLAHGIEVKRGVHIKRAGLLALSERYAGVFVATGLQQSRMLRLGQDDGECVIDGLDFLEHVECYRTRLAGQDIVVIGGGNTAVDVARSAVRLGARHVHILYRRSRREMPALTEEVEEALAEGIRLEELVAPVRLDLSGPRPTLTCTRLRLGPPDDSGRAQPLPMVSEDASFDVLCDRVISAIGQTADLSIWPEGTVVCDGPNVLGRTGAPIFAGGDFATADGTVASAIGSGRRAAWHIHFKLTGEDCFPLPRRVVQPEEIKRQAFANGEQERGDVLQPHWRRRTFAEVNRGFADDPCDTTAVREAARCASCGVCNNCDACLTHCPEGVMVRTEDGYDFNYDYCKGCGICATQCPRGVITMADL